MQSVMARIIAFAALLPLTTLLWRFLEQALLEYRHDGLAVSQGAFYTLGEGIVSPVTLFAFAAIVEMLHRIAQKLPPVSSQSSAKRVSFGRWRSTIAKLLLVAAGLMYLVNAWAAYLYFSGEQSTIQALAEEQQFFGSLAFVFYWLTEPLWLVAMAASVEYLSRVAAAMAPPAGEDAATPPAG
jgi:hypothetical protein